MILQLTAALTTLAASALFVRARFVGDPPAHAGPHAVLRETLQVPGSAAAFPLHVWRPETLDPTQRAPLLLFAPGWGGHATDSSLICADLASRGYVVVGFDDVKWDPGADAAEVADRRADLDVSSEQAVQRSKRAGFVRTRLEVKKARLVLDGLTQLAQRGESWWARVNTERIGMLGFSFGGAVAPEVAHEDPRFQASANLDGGLFGDVITRGFPRGYLLLSSSESFPPDSDFRSADNWRRLSAEWSREDLRTHAKSLGQADFHWFLADNSHHEDFSDGVFTPQWRDAVRRSWAKRTAERVAISALLAAFFDTYVRGIASPLMRDAPAPAGTRRITAWP